MIWISDKLDHFHDQMESCHARFGDGSGRRPGRGMAFSMNGQQFHRASTAPYAQVANLRPLVVVVKL